MKNQPSASSGIKKIWHRIQIIPAPGSLSKTKIPVRTKITIPYLLLAVLLAISAGVMITNVVFDTIEERFNNQLADTGVLASELMVREEDKMLETLRLIVNSSGVATALQQNDPNSLRILTLGIAANQQAEIVEILDKQGNPILSMIHNTGGSLEDYSYSTGGDKNQYIQYEFIRKVLENSEDQYGDKYAGIVPENQSEYFFVSGPIYDENGKFTGVLLVGTSLEKMSIRIRDKALGHITFYTFDGQPIASTFSSLPDKIEPALSTTVIAMQDSGNSKTRGFNEQREQTINNNEYTEILGPWEIRSDADLGIMGAALQRNFFVNPSPYTRSQLIGIVTLAFLLIILIGIYLANLITRPLLRIVNASSEVAKGNLSVHVEPDSNDEVAVLARSFNQMIDSLNQSRTDILEAYDTALIGWTKALELRDKETEGHTERVTDLTVALAQELGFLQEEIVNIRRGALLHDIGKMGIPDYILHKAGPLSEDEWVIMKKHPLYAYDMLKDIRFLTPALDIPLCHHEHWDGKGYPNGMEGEEIPFSARIFAVVDCWDALTNDRPYRQKLPEEEALRIIKNSAGKLYDPTIVDLFERYIQETTEKVAA